MAAGLPKLKCDIRSKTKRKGFFNPGRLVTSDYSGKRLVFEDLDTRDTQRRMPRDKRSRDWK